MRQGMNLDADGYLTKSVTRDRHIDIITACLRRSLQHKITFIKSVQAVEQFKQYCSRA